MTDDPSRRMERIPIVASTVSRNLMEFDMLIEEMDAGLGENWGDLGFDEAIAFFSHGDASSLELIVIAMTAREEANLPLISEIIDTAGDHGVQVILVTSDVSSAALKQLKRAGASDNILYPISEGQVQSAISRLRLPEPGAPQTAGTAPNGQGIHAAAASNGPRGKTSTDRNGVLIAVHGLAGGVGATTFATNLAWELANVAKQDAPKVCLMDLDFQYGSVATYLDLPRRDAVFELLSGIEHMDHDGFIQAMMGFQEKLQVLTAPADFIPLDLLPPEDIDKLLTMATAQFDYVIVDMPKTLVQWSETVLKRAQVFFSMLELDMRSAQNALRLKRGLQTEDLPFEKLRFVVNRAPRLTDLVGKGRLKRMAESLDISIDLRFPDGGKTVAQACDHGTPLAVAASGNPLRREIAKLAKSLHQIGQDAANVG